jgi:hypothetical protein
MGTAVQTEIDRAPRMSAYALAQTQEFSHLSPKMARFVLAYVQTLIDTDTADPLAAVKAAYSCGSEESARTLGYELLANPKVILVLNIFFGVTPSEAFLKQVERAIYNPNLRVAQIDALKLYCDAHGIARSGVGVVASKAQAKNHGHASTKDASEPATVNDTNDSTAPTRFAVGDFCYQNGKKFRITSVDTTGHPLTADPVEGEAL